MTNETKLKRSFGAAVRQFRHERKLTQQQLADTAGMLRTYLADVERGQRNVALANINRLTAALDVPPSTFFKVMEKLAAAPASSARSKR